MSATLSSEKDLPWCYHQLSSLWTPEVLHTSKGPSLHMGELVGRLRTCVIPSLSYLIVLRACSPTQRSADEYTKRDFAGPRFACIYEHILFSLLLYVVTMSHLRRNERVVIRRYPEYSFISVSSFHHSQENDGQDRSMPRCTL